MAGRAYGQCCGLARALEVVGERWTMLIVRDLLVSPKRFTDILNGLPGIPTNGLTTRLKELEEDGVVRRRALARPDRSVVYELTDYGRALQETVDALGRWGTKRLGQTREGEILTQDAMMTAMRATFQPAAARGVRATYELRLGHLVFNLRIAGSKLSVNARPLPGADLIIESGPAIRMLLSGELSAHEAVERGFAKITGDPKLMEQFSRMFRIA
jgi:DNA-binding HxlR family transcriptional regulator